MITRPSAAPPLQNALEGSWTLNAALDRVAHRLRWHHLVRYDSHTLEWAPDQLLHRTVPTNPPTAPVTFERLYDATHMRLYVIVGDASTGVPVPFCVETTPDLPVATAVIASCSIPVLFPARYAVVDTTAGGLAGPPIRRLLDGGLWANFPAFTFTDEAFRQRQELGRTPSPDPTADRCHNYLRPHRCQQRRRLRPAGTFSWLGQTA